MRILLAVLLAAVAVFPSDRGGGEDEGERCDAVVVFVCGDLVVPPFEEEPEG